MLPRRALQWIVDWRRSLRCQQPPRRSCRLCSVRLPSASVNANTTPVYWQSIKSWIYVINITELVKTVWHLGLCLEFRIDLSLVSLSANGLSTHYILHFLSSTLTKASKWALSSLFDYLNTFKLFFFVSCHFPATEISLLPLSSHLVTSLGTPSRNVTSRTPSCREKATN